MKFSERVRLAKDYDKWLKEFNESETDFQLKGCALTVITFLEEIGALNGSITLDDVSKCLCILQDWKKSEL